MIVTVTMNPAIDKTVEIEKLIPGGLNRILKMEQDAGGKGINVSKTIHELGGKSIATGFLGGNTGQMIENTLNDSGILCDFVHIKSATRINTKIFEESGAVTELNEPGPTVTKEEIDRLLQKLEKYASEETLFILSGSVPKGADSEHPESDAHCAISQSRYSEHPKSDVLRSVSQGMNDDIYGQIIRLVRPKGARVLLDADGPLFAKAVSETPDIIKPNIVELSRFAGSDRMLQKEKIKELASDFLRQGIETVVVSQGADGAMFFWDGCIIECPALPVKAHSTVGAGDAMVAALALAWEKKLDKEKTARLCMAVSAGAVMTIGTKPPEFDIVEQLKEKVIINVV